MYKNLKTLVLLSVFSIPSSFASTSTLPDDVTTTTKKNIIAKDVEDIVKDAKHIVGDVKNIGTGIWELGEDLLGIKRPHHHKSTDKTKSTDEEALEEALEDIMYGKALMDLGNAKEKIIELEEEKRDLLALKAKNEQEITKLQEQHKNDIQKLVDQQNIDTKRINDLLELTKKELATNKQLNDDLKKEKADLDAAMAQAIKDHDIEVQKLIQTAIDDNNKALGDNKSLQKELEDTNSKTTKDLTDLKKEHAKALDEQKQQHADELTKKEKSHQQELQLLKDKNSQLQKERDSLADELNISKANNATIQNEKQYLDNAISQFLSVKLPEPIAKGKPFIQSLLFAKISDPTLYGENEITHFGMSISVSEDPFVNLNDSFVFSVFHENKFPETSIKPFKDSLFSHAFLSENTHHRLEVLDIIYEDSAPNPLDLQMALATNIDLGNTSSVQAIGQILQSVGIISAAAPEKFSLTDFSLDSNRFAKGVTLSDTQETGSIPDNSEQKSVKSESDSKTQK